MTTINANQTTSRDTFVDGFTTLVNACVSVVAVRTREPFRALSIIKEMAFAAPDTDFRHWTMTEGWATFDKANPNEEANHDGTVAPLAALQAIEPASHAGNQRDAGGFPASGYYAMMWPHFVMKDSKLPPFLQVLSRYAQLLPETKKRLFLIVPFEFQVPPEVEDCITILDLELPSHVELAEVFEEIVSGLREDIRPRYGEGSKAYTDDDMHRIVNAGLGMTVQEFDTAVARAFVDHRAMLPDLPADTLVEAIMHLKTEVVKRSEVLEVMPSGSMADVGGLDNLKTWVETRRHCFTEEAHSFGVDQPKGIALIGPPGTGKSLSAKAVAHSLSLPLIKFDVSRVFTSLVGASEGKVRAALKQIDAMAPCVAFLDELDKAFDMNSGGGDSGVGKRVLGAILTHMQESEKPVFWVMTANRTEGLPPEMLRKGRLDEVFSVSVPSPDERREIMRIHLAKRGWDMDEVEGLDDAVSGSDGYVPAEIEAAVKEAITIHYARWVDGGRDGDMEPLTGALIVEQLGEMKPLSEAFKDQFEAMQSWAESNARPANKQMTALKSKRTRPSSAVGAGGSKRKLAAGAMDG